VSVLDAPQVAPMLREPVPERATTQGRRSHQEQVNSQFSRATFMVSCQIEQTTRRALERLAIVTHDFGGASDGLDESRVELFQQRQYLLTHADASEILIKIHLVLAIINRLRTAIAFRVGSPGPGD
jgi:hypothetical protein